MIPSARILAHWYFHLPNLILAVLTYLVLARWVVVPILKDGRIVRFLRRIADPVLAAVAFVTPKAVPQGALALFAIGWLYLARLALFFTVVSFGIRPVLW